MCLRRSWGSWEDLRGATVGPQAVAAGYDSEHSPSCLSVPSHEPGLKGSLSCPLLLYPGARVSLTDTGTHDADPY